MLHQVLLGLPMLINLYVYVHVPYAWGRFGWELRKFGGLPVQAPNLNPPIFSYLHIYAWQSRTKLSNLNLPNTVNI